MKTVFADIETELIPKRGHTGVNTIWCVVTQEKGEEPRVWTDENYKALKDYAMGVDRWVFHNGLGFDVPVLNRVLGLGIQPDDVVDTLVVSRTIAYGATPSHSLAALGERFGVPKDNFKDFSRLSDEMIRYCKQDVKVTQKVYEMYERYIDDPSWAKALKTEHQMAWINQQMSANGFKFNVPMAKAILSNIKSDMTSLEAELKEAWPDELQEVNRIKLRYTSSGQMYKNCVDAIGRYPRYEVEGDEIVLMDWIPFNPGSPKDRIDKLTEAGWDPWDKTKTHQKFTRARVGEMWGKSLLTPELYEEKREHFLKYGWAVNEDNLATLPDDAPAAAQRLSEWLCLEGRRSSLEEWLGVVAEDGRIHGSFHNIGAWTGRMAHSSPNQANIFSPFHGDPKNAVERVKKKYNYALRALWETDKVLVGTDADAIQLRILAHYMKSETYRDAILVGRKEDETDIHNVNKRALGDACRDRDTAKTFIYAWLLGAALAKIGAILRCTTAIAKTSVNNFLNALPELKSVKRGMIPLDAARGYFVGVDGRKVMQDSQHLMLAGYLQNGEAVAMKMWIIEWTRMCDEAGLWYRLVDFVHDEVQVEVLNYEDAEKLIAIQKEAMKNVSEDLELFCPLEVSADVGKNWAETH